MACPSQITTGHMKQLVFALLVIAATVVATAARQAAMALAFLLVQYTCGTARIAATPPQTSMTRVLSARLRSARAQTPVRL